MTNLYKIALGAMFLGSTMITISAQQPGNGGFENDWKAQAPWTSNGNTNSVGQMQDPENPDGDFLKNYTYNCPSPWTISNVIGINGVGATGTGYEAKGRNSGKAVYIFNSRNSLLATQIVPGYISLGKTWSTSVMGNSNDGGSFGGIEFAYRPDALQFYYKRSRGAAPEGATDAVKATYKPNEQSTIVAYLWKGTYTQKDVPGNIGIMAGQLAKADMIDRDRQVLGMDMSACLGGEKSKTDDAELIASLNTKITENAADWTLFEQPLTYHSEATPQKANIIIAAGDYFGGAEVVGRNNSITVDDVRFVYYSRLKSISFDGKPAELKDGTYEYTIQGDMPTDKAKVAYAVLGQSAKAEVELIPADSRVKVTVSNIDADSDGAKSHVYVFTFKKAQGKTYPGYLTVDMGTGDISDNAPANVTITPKGDNKCDFLLPNLSLGSLGTLGDIAVNDVNMTTDQNGLTKYNGKVNGMKLMNNMIEADVTVTGTTDAQDKIDMKIDVIWTNAPTGSMPIYVTFKSEKTSGIDNVTIDSNETIEYYNLQGIRVNPENAPAGIYIRKQGNRVEKIHMR